MGFARFKRGLEAELSLEQNGLHGLETQAVPGGQVESVRGIGFVERLGEKLHETQPREEEEEGVNCTEDEQGSGEMECVRLAAQFPGPTAAREFVVCSVKKASYRGTDIDLPNAKTKGRQFMIVSRPVVECEEVCPAREGYVRGQFESVEFIREVVLEQDESVMEEWVEPEGENGVESNWVDDPTAGDSEESENPVEETIVGSDEDKNLETSGRRPRRRRKRQHHLTRHEDDSLPGSNLLTPTSSEPETPMRKNSKEYPVEWVMISRSDPGGNVPRWVVERGTPASILKDAEKFLTWLSGLSDENLGLRTWKKEKQQERAQGLNEGFTSSVLEVAGEVVGSLAPAKLLPTSNGRNDESEGASMSQYTPSTRPSYDSISMRSFSTAPQQTSESPPHTPSSTSTGCEGLSNTESHSPTPTLSTSETALPLSNDDCNPAEIKPLSRLISQKSHLLSRLEKALAKNRRGEEGEEKLREKYEDDVRKAGERYKRTIERIGLRQEREAVKAKEKLEREKDKRETRKKKRAGSGASQKTVEAVKVIVEKLTKENEMLVRENEELRAKVRELLEAPSESTGQQVLSEPPKT